MDDKFYQLVNNPGDENKAACVAINVSVSRNPTYSENLSANDKQEIREHWESLLLDFYKKHKQGNVSRKEFFGYVDTIKEYMNSHFPDRFQNDTEGYDKEFRLAHAQKSLSVFLKHLWCMGKMKEPPFCPIDGIILNDVLKKKGAWTKLNDKDTYDKYIEYVDKAVEKSNMNVAEWEYSNWNDAVTRRIKKNTLKGGNVKNRLTNDKPLNTVKKKCDDNDTILITQENVLFPLPKNSNVILESFKPFFGLTKRIYHDEFVVGYIIPLKEADTGDEKKFMLFVARNKKGYFCQIRFCYDEVDILNYRPFCKITQNNDDAKWERSSNALPTFKTVFFDDGNNGKKNALCLMRDVLNEICAPIEMIEKIQNLIVQSE